MSDSDSEKVYSSGSGEPVATDMARALREAGLEANAGAGAEDGEELKPAEADSGPVESPAEQMARMAEASRLARESAARAQVAQAAAGAEPDKPGTSAEHRGGSRGPQKSRFDGEDLAYLDPRNEEFVHKTLEWYAAAFESENLTAEKALDLLRDARSQGLYRFRRETGERTPIRVRDEDLRRQVVALFGEGTGTSGRAEERLRELRAAERTSREPGHQQGAGTERSGDRPLGMRSRINALEGRINELLANDPDSRDGWKAILDEFIIGGVYSYRDKPDPVSNVGNSELRAKAEELFKTARENYERARKRGGADGAKPGPAASAPNQTGQKEPKAKRKKLSREAQAAEDSYELEEFASDWEAAQAARAGMQDPDGQAEEFRRKEGSMPRTIDRLASNLGLPPSQEPQVQEPLGVDEPGQPAGEGEPAGYDESLEELMAEAYKRDPVARGLEVLRRKFKKEIDRVSGKVSAEELERMRGRQQDLLKLEHDKLQAIEDEKARARMRKAEIDRLKSSGRG